MTYSCPTFKFYVNIYKLFRFKLKPAVNETFCKLSKITQNITYLFFFFLDLEHLIEN